MRNVLSLALTPLLAGCPALDVMEGKPSPYKAAQEARVAVLVAEPVVAAVVAPSRSLHLLRPLSRNR